MGTTSEKLTYLNTTKEKIRDSINLTGANIGTSDTFRSYATKLKLGLIDIINNGIDTLYNNFPKVSGIGSNLSLTPTYEAPMKLNEIQGDTFQQTYEGNNLLNPIPNTLPNTLNGISVTRNTDGSLDINGTATSNWANITNKISTNLEPNTYKFLINSELTHTIVLRLTYSDETYSDLNILAGSKKREITTAKTIVSYYVYLILNAGTTYSEKVYLQLKLSSSSDDYEPYVGGTASPNPDYPQTIQNVTGLQNIEVCGKNLFDGELEIGGLGGSGEETTSSTNCRSKNYIEINSNETYTLSADTNENIALRFYDENKNFISSGTSAGSPNTFTTPNNAEYLRFMLINNTDLSTQCQLEKGSTATSYEEYKGQSYEINLGKNLYDVSTCTNAYINSTGVVTSANTNLLTDYIKIDNTKKYTISLNTEFYFIGCAYYDKNKTYLSRDTINNSSSLTITIPNNTEYIRVWMSYATNTNISKTSVMQYEPMIEKGTQRTLYSPYFTPIELNKIGNYQDSIKRSTGKNLFDKQEIIDNEAYLNKFNASNLTTNSSGISWEATGNDSYISLPATITDGYGMYIEVEENTQYTLSFNSNYELTNYIHYIKGDYTFISRNNSLGHNSNVSFTTPSNCRYIFIRFGVQNQTGNTINITNIQIELGSTATEYEPYLPIDTWYIHKEIEKTVLNGSEDWLANTSNGRTFMLNMTYPNRVGKSNRFNYSNEVSLESKNVFYFGNQQINFVNPKVNNTLINTLEDWKLYLKEQYDNSIPVLVYHILATPTDTLITNTELIEDLETLYTAKSQEGTTNISITSEDLEMILNISALEGDA